MINIKSLLRFLEELTLYRTKPDPGQYDAWVDVILNRRKR